jgi:hypothetical protein
MTEPSTKPPAIQIDHEGSPGGRREPEGCNGAEYLVLRRPDGYRRHLELREGTHAPYGIDTGAARPSFDGLQ